MAWPPAFAPIEYRGQQLDEFETVSRVPGNSQDPA